MSRIGWRLAVAAPAVALVLGGMLGSGCRSAAPVAPRTTGPARVDPLSGWAGQMRILRHRGDKGKWTVKRQDLRAASGTCDVAVEVRQARFDRGTATFTLDMVGRPRLQGRGARQERCGDDQAQIVMSITGFEPAATTAELDAVLADVLYTPEAYLKSYAVAYTLPVPAAPAGEAPKANASAESRMKTDASTKAAAGKPAAAKPEAAKAEAKTGVANTGAAKTGAAKTDGAKTDGAKTDAASTETTKVDQNSYKVEALRVDVPIAAHHLTKQANRVLWVDAITRDPSGRISHEAEVEFNAVVGSDGRIHHPKLSTALSEEHEKRVLRVLPLWRFEPARRGADPAAAAVIERMVFRIY